MMPEESSSENFKVDGAMLRHCFDTYSYEWNTSSIEEKISTIAKIIEENDTNSFSLAMKTLHSLNQEYRKDVTMIDLVMALGSMLDYLIKERKMNSKE